MVNSCVFYSVKDSFVSCVALKDFRSDLIRLYDCIVSGFLKHIMSPTCIR